MKRKHFLKHTALAAPVVASFNPFAAGSSSFFQSLLPGSGTGKKQLVLIQLNGGNDSLNTVIPLDKYDILSTARKSVLIPDSKVMKLNDSSVFGLHPALKGLNKLYSDKLVTFVQDVGYANPEFSHFAGIDIKCTADLTGTSRKSGWIGRYLEQEYTGYPQGYPHIKTDGPPTIRVGSVNSGSVSPKYALGNTEDFSVAFTEGTGASSSAPKLPMGAVSNDMAGRQLEAIKAITRQIEIYAPVIQSYSNRQNNLSKLYPERGKNDIADQLRVVARLIGGGLNTPVFAVHQTGYDTHADQVDRSDPTLGKHAQLLTDFDAAITAFMDDLHLMNKQDDVLVMTYSEFGRRILSTDSYGTDHGTAETVMLLGAKVNNGIIGTSPDLPKKVTADDNVKYQYDFRSVYATVLNSWLDVPNERISKIIPECPTDRLKLVKV